jgi:hypothetical protein
VKDPDDLDVYRPARRADPGRIARGVARAAGILAGLAACLYGIALYALRCFDTCPSDPAQDAVGQLLSGSLVVFGLAVVAVAASVGTRAARSGLAIAAVFGCLVGVFGVVSIALVPAIDAPGDHASSTVFGALALAAGAVTAAVAAVLRRRGQSS